MTNVLSLDGLTKHFGGVAAAEGVSFNLDRGECLGLIGPNGAGKTTVVAMVAGELDAEAGEVILAGRNVTKMPAYKRARFGIARTYQRLEVFPEMTVRDHLVVAQSASRGTTGVWRDLSGRGRPTSAEIDRADAVLATIGLGPLAERVVGTLSLGQCRLVELARAVVNEPVVLLADEPSSGLDDYETNAMVEVLATLQRDAHLSIVLIEHDLGMVAALSDRVVVMDMGRVIGEGSYDEVINLDAVQTAYLGAAR
jgi:branched-chain amino acid transport system ATP-binding protein